MDEDLTKMGRRRFTKVASALGISATSLRFGTQEGLAEAMDRPKDEVSYVSRMKVIEDEDGTPIGREPIYDTIPRDEWVDLETTTEVQRQVTSQLERQFPDSPSLHASITAMDDSPTGFGVVVQYAERHKADGTVLTPAASREAVESALPDTLDATAGKDKWTQKRSDIPVVVTEKVIEKQCYSHDWTDIPGACDLNGGTANGTFYHNDEYHLITAGHVVDAPKSDWGNPDKADSDGYVLDKVDQSNRDYALLRTYSNNANPMIRNDSSTNPDTDYYIYGAYTDDTIRNDFLNTGRTAKYQGRVTGRVSTEVVAWSDNDTSLNTDQSFQVQQDAQGGDSGGVIFDIDSDDNGVWMMGVIFDYGYYGARCNSAESVENNYSGYYH